MAAVKVARAVLLQVSEVATVLYPAGFTGTAPRAHIDRIVAAGAGEPHPPVASKPSAQAAPDRSA